MKNLILPFFLSLAFVVQGQTPDTAAIRVEIDSLIELNRSLLKEQKLDEALQVIKQAEKKCLTAFGEVTALYATIVNKIGIIYYYKGDVSTVESLWLKAKNIRAKAVGKDHPDYAESLNNLGALYINMGNYEKAEQMYVEAIAIQEKALGKEHSEYAGSLNNLAVLYKEMGQFEKAEQMYVEAIAIREKALGKEHPDYASSLENLANLYTNMGQNEKAEPLYLEAKSILEKTLGKEHPDYASTLNGLAILYFNMGKYEIAETLHLEAKAIRRMTFGKDHPDYAQSLNNLTNLYFRMGKYEIAELLQLEAKTIYGKVFGKDHPKYARSLNNLANLYYDMGQYENAEQLYLETNAIMEVTLGKTHPNYAQSLNNLANLYYDMGLYEIAEPLYLETNAIMEEVFGENHPDYAWSLNNLAGLYNDMDQNVKAELLYLEAIAIREKALGKEHPDYASSLNNLAILYRKMGQSKKAEHLVLEAIDIRKKTLGENHPEYAVSLTGLANLYYDMGKFKKAEPLFLETKMIMEKALGKEHPNYALSLNGLANLYRKMNQPGKAKLLYVEANDIEKTLLIKASRYLSERELLAYINKFIDKQSQFLSFAQLQTGLSESAYDNSLFYKGFLLNATQQVNRLAQTDSTSTDMFYQLKGYNRRLASAYSNPITERDSNIIAELEEKANTLEKELTRSVAGFGEALRQVNWEEIQAVLKTGEAAIEFVHYRYSDPKLTDSIMYAALVLRPGDEQPRFIPLFEEKQIKQVLSGKDQNENIALAYGSRGLTPKKKKDLQGLYSLIWQPLEEQLTGVEKVYYSPSGLMHRINFAAIPIDQSKSLSDNYQLTRLASTRSLVIADLTKPNSKNEAVLFGGIEYEMQETLALKGESSEANTTTRSSELSFSYTDRSTPQRGDNWNYLSGTKSEVENIDRLLNQSKFEVTTFSELQATEESFKALGAGKASPRILHLATHGFFFPDPKNESQSTLSGQEPVFKISDHPMIRSGLILAGGNHAWKTGKAMYPDMEDGILTAYEISQMDLSHTELVVLSACETGLGDIEGNEGVYGLQRAFKIAGAKYLIMSLWQVPDHQTQELMTLFYSKCLPAGQAGLEGKMEISEAFRAAQKEMRQKYDDPYFWAGFVLVE